ncbi:MAG TPA: DUF6624 domain-containing protein [Vicinamibacterales bacterium]|nr:DUF6624 domain-containing protein [Vicinamibacterales bacterium]
MRHAFGPLLLAGALLWTSACARQPSPDSTAATDTALAERVERLVDTVLTADDDKTVAAAFAEAREIFERDGVLSVARVGDAPAYSFVFINLQKADPAFRAAFVVKVQDAASRGELPGDAAAFAEARRQQLDVEDRYASRPPANPELRDRISALVEADQAARPQGTPDLEKMAAADRKTAGPLKAIFDRYGVPTFELVGVRAAKDFVVMVQHQPAEFRRVVLPKLKNNVDAGQADPASYATVYDRTQRDQGKRQLYGQHFECAGGKDFEVAPMEDPDGVNLRRARLGLMRLEMYGELLRRYSPNACAAMGPHK